MTSTRTTSPSPPTSPPSSTPWSTASGASAASENVPLNSGRPSSTHNRPGRPRAKAPFPGFIEAESYFTSVRDSAAHDMMSKALTMPKWLHAVTFAAAAASISSAQTEVSQKDEPALFKSRVNLVQVPVVVRDRAGKAIGSLTKEDFQLFDKGKPQFIARFSMEKAS